MTYEEIWNQIDQQQLPGGKVALFLYDDGCDEEYCGDRYQDYLFLQPAFLMLMVMPVMMLVLVAAASVLMVMMLV